MTDGDNKGEISTEKDGEHKHNINGNTEIVGEGEFIDNRPQYYAVFYIMKL
jgi:hypothetical protein